jgi:hypothetical protein
LTLPFCLFCLQCSCLRLCQEPQSWGRKAWLGRTHGKHNVLRDYGSAWRGGAQLQPETVSSPLVLGHLCQAPHCPPCLREAWGQDGQPAHSKGERGWDDAKQSAQPHCPSLGLPLSCWEVPRGSLGNSQKMRVGGSWFRGQCSPKSFDCRLHCPHFLLETKAILSGPESHKKLLGKCSPISQKDTTDTGYLAK